MKAVVDVNKTLLVKLSEQPIIKTWIEEGSIIFKTLITNPSSTATQKVPLKYYLPKELKEENVIKMDEGLKLDYDASQEAYFVYGEFELEPNETKILSVETEDIWMISPSEVESLRKQAEELMKPLRGTAYFAQGSLVKSDIDASLDKILRIQEEATTPQGRIRAYREAKEELRKVEDKIETMKALVASAGSLNSVFGFVGGVQTIGIWGLIIVLVAGLVSLGIFMGRLYHSAGQTVATGLEQRGQISPAVTERDFKFEMIGKRIKKILIFVLIMVGTAILTSLFLFKLRGFF